MIVRRFLLWARHAPASQRAEAVRALAQTYLSGVLSADDHAEAETALTVMVGDCSPLVRGALAETLGGSEHAPRHAVLALAGDQVAVAQWVLRASPLLADGDLVDCAALGCGRVQAAIAARPHVSAGLSAALAEIGEIEALLVLARNPGADILDTTLARLVERHGGDGALREALLGRADLPVEIVQSLAAALAASLSGFVSECGWLTPERSTRVTREARERTTIALSGRADPADQGRLVEHLRRSGQLTPVLILRALLSCRIAFAEAALADLAGYPVERVSAILHERQGAGFRALYGRTGLPASLRGAFEAALAAQHPAQAGEGSTRLSRHVISGALAACARSNADETGRVAALLRRFEAEAALVDAQAAADVMADDAALALVLEYAPETLMIEAPNERRLLAA